MFLIAAFFELRVDEVASLPWQHPRLLGLRFLCLIGLSVAQIKL
jgi:hypothetical protein